MFDYIIIGTGFAGSVIAERIVKIEGKKVLMIEKNQHIGGNAFDRYDENGVLIHQYGPHIFHTKLKEVWDYLSEFTEWENYHHHVLGVIDGKKVPIPFNLNTLYDVFPFSFAKNLEEKLMIYFGFNKKIPILELRSINDQDLKFLAEYIYEKIFLHYTTKQWGIKPEELDPSVTGRVPVYISKDNRYFQDRYQGMPRQGYTKLFERMLDHPNIKVMLNTDYKEVVEIDFNTQKIYLFGQEFTGKLVYTGPIDYFFDYKYGKLPYRSLRFYFENLKQECYQEVGTVNYPNDYDFTRITEFKNLTGQKIDSTTIVKEYSQEYVPGLNIPYYPIKNEENFMLYKRYKDETRLLKNVLFVGRLAEYQYYDMDAVVSKALRVFKERINE